MTDHVRISGLRVFARHGVLPHEAEYGQVFVIDVDASLDLAPAGKSDELGHTLHYGRLAAAVAELVATRRRNLIEAVAEDVAQLVLAEPGVEEVTVTVTKPHAPIAVDGCVSVQITRSRPEAGPE
jgi:dihydroneopterin aldolase